MAKEPYVFISYARTDRPFVERLADGLHAAGVRTWTDVEDIAAGSNWQQEIQKGLLQATVLVYVSSKNSIKSRWMEAELGAVVRNKGRIIPVIIDDEGAQVLPAALQSIQWADFRGSFEPALRSLLTGIRSLQGETPIAAQRVKSKGYVFISYAEEDSDFVGGLKAFLKQHGYAYWDFRESQRDYQADYTLELEGVIKDAAATLSIVSPDWKRSPTSLQELHFSKEIGTPVFLLKVRDPGPTLAVAGMSFIDFMGQQQTAFSKLDGEMKRRGL